MKLARFGLALLVGCGLVQGALGADTSLKPVSYKDQIAPIFTASCIGCHAADKKKGGFDMSSHRALMAGGKEGKMLVAGDPAKSRLIEVISGDKPEMPEKGDPLKKEQVELIARWIKEGAKDDSPVVKIPDGPAGTPGPEPLAQPPVYPALPVITSLLFTPDGSMIAVSGYSEVVLHKADGSEIIGRLVGGAPRIESMAVSPDGKKLAVTGGAAALFGNLQVWDLAEKKLEKNYKTSRDTLFGVSWSPDGQKIAFGCADKSARVLLVSDGREILRLDQHSDWCLATCWTTDGSKLVTGSRDQAMKLTDAAMGQLIDDINNPLDAVIAMQKHPKEDQVIYGGQMGSARIYKISDNQKRTSGRNDVNRLKEFERQPGPVHAVAWSADGSKVVLGSIGEARIYNRDGAKIATLPGHDGAIFAAAFSSDGSKVATGGYDGKVRLFDAKDGKLIKAFEAVPTSLSQLQKQAAK